MSAEPSTGPDLTGTGWSYDDTPVDEVARQAEVYGGFTDSLRELVDLAIRSEVDLAEIERAHEQVRAITERLRRQVLPGGWGGRLGPGPTRAWGNAAMGLRNAVAPPLQIRTDGVGEAWAEFTLGAAYEGPPTLVHGGMSAMVLDHVLGCAAGADGRPRFTGTLSVRYLRGTPLGPLTARARIVRTEGVKGFVTGELCDAEGPTVTAEGVFILPRWARTGAGRPG